MTIRLKPLEKMYPGSGYDTNIRRSVFFAKGAIEYFRACIAVVERRDDLGLGFHVELPLMHLTVELLLKAFALRIDKSFDPKKASHKTEKLITAYADRVAVFASVRADEQKMALIHNLEAAWEPVRYDATYIEYEGSDWKLFGELIDQLADAFFAEAKLPLFARHYEQRSREMSGGATT